jgi:hypothetical protein
MTTGFKKAKRTAKKVKIAIQGASGAGKTYSALAIATALVARTDPGKGIAFIDTEKSADLYAPPFTFDIDDDFGEGPKLSYHPDRLIEKMEAARKSGEYGAVIVDSLTHFWKEQGGLLAMIDAICSNMKAKGQKADSFAAWKSVDPVYRKLFNYIRQYPLHVVLCVRAKQDYERTEGQGGKGSLKKVGLVGEMREGWEYEVDAQFAIDADHVLAPLKHRLGAFLDGKIFRNPGDDVAQAIEEWLTQGAPGQNAPEPVKVATGALIPPDDGSHRAEDTAATESSIPAAPTSEPPGDEPPVLETLTARMLAAASLDELRGIGNDVKAAVKDKRISGDDYNAISKTYASRQRELKGAA